MNGLSYDPIDYRKYSRVKNSLNAVLFDKKYEDYAGVVSETVPDQSMSIKEILLRYSKGLPLGGGKVPMWDEEDDFPDPKTLDLSELEDMRIEAEETIKSYSDRKKKLDVEKQQREEKEYKQYLKDKYKKSLKTQEDGKENNVEETSGDV